MNEAITLRDDQAQQGQPLVPPPIQGSSLRFKTNEFVSLKDDSLWEISETHPELVEAFVYAVSCVRERIDVVEQLAFIPGRSRHIALLSQTAAELDEVIPKITIALQAPDIGEDAFSLVRRLLSLEGMLRALRSFLFPHIPDIDRAIYAIEIAFQFYDSSEPFLELLYRFLETLWLYKRLGMRLHSSMIGQFSQYEEALNTTTETIGLVQSNPLDDGPEINIVAQLYGGISTIDTSLKRVGSVGKSIPVIAGVLSIQGALQAYRFCFLKCIENVIRSIPTIQTPSNFRDSNVWIKADAAHPYKSQMLEMRQQQEVLTSSVSCEGIHLPPECLCRVLLKISRENDTLSILSRAVELQIRTRPVQYDTHSILFVDVYETICFIDCVLQMIDIDESAFELVVGLLLSQLYVLIVYSWVRAFEEQLPSSCSIQSEARYPDYSDRINYIIEVIHHFFGSSEHITGIILSLSNRFRWPHELSAFFALCCISQTTQSTNSEDPVQLQKYTLVQHPRFTSTELVMAVMPLVTAVGMQTVIIPQEMIPSCRGILQSCMYLPGIEDVWTCICLRDYGTRLSAMCSSSDMHNVCLNPSVFWQILTFVELCIQHRISVQHPQPEALPTGRWSSNKKPSRENEKLDEDDLEWRVIIVYILYRLLKVAAIDGDASQLDAVIKCLQFYTLPHRECGSYIAGFRLKFPLKNKSYLCLRQHFLNDWRDLDRSATMKGGPGLDNSITGLKMQFHSEHLDETHKAIVAFILTNCLYQRGHLSQKLKNTPQPCLEQSFSEAYTFFGYFLRHWPYPFETSSWTAPSCELLYCVLLHSMENYSTGYNLVRTSVRKIWDQRWKQPEKTNGSRDNLKEYQPRQMQKLEASRDLTSRNANLESETLKQVALLQSRFSTKKHVDLLQVYHNKVIDQNTVANVNLRTLDIYSSHNAICKSFLQTYVVVKSIWIGLKCNDVRWSDDTESKLVNVLDISEHILNDPDIQRFTRFLGIQQWFSCMMSMIIIERLRPGSIQVISVKERCKVSLPKISVISWTMLEDISWTALSIWGSIADRQIIFRDTHIYLIALHQTLIRSFPEFVIEDIEMWEGSGMIWTQLQHLRSPVDHLANIDQKLANRLQTLQEIFTQQWVLIDDDDDEQRGPTIHYREKSNFDLYREWIEVLTEIRRLPGFEMFFKEKTFSELIKVSRDGPVVLLPNPDHFGIVPLTTAFVFYRCESEPAVTKVLLVSLPLLNNKLVMQLRHSLTDIAKTRHDSDAVNDIIDIPPECRKDNLDARAPLSDSDCYEFSQQDHSHRVGIFKSRHRFQDALAVLKKLWDVIAEPILDSIMRAKQSDNKDEGKGKSKVWHWQDKPPPRHERGRIWWCCLEDLSFLPIHAAGIYHHDGSSTCVSDFFISSYTPSLSALIDTRNRPLPQPESIKVLAAAQPNADSIEKLKWKPLPSTKKELEEIARIVPKQNLLYLNGQDQLDFMGEHTTVKNVLDVLPEASILHLACHGEQDRYNPLKSGFILKNGERLTIQELIKQRTPNAYMAVLSACHTASNDAVQPEESMNLTRTAIFLGFSTIVGTKWPMADADGPALAKAIYSALFAASNTNSESCQQLDVDDASTTIGPAKPHPRNPLESFCLAKVLDDFVYGLRKRGVPATRWATFVHVGI